MEESGGLGGHTAVDSRFEQTAEERAAPMSPERDHFGADGDALSVALRCVRVGAFCLLAVVFLLPGFALLALIQALVGCLPLAALHFIISGAISMVLQAVFMSAALLVYADFALPAFLVCIGWIFTVGLNDHHYSKSN